MAVYTGFTVTASYSCDLDLGSWWLSVVYDTPGISLAILGRDPTAFQIEKSNVVNPLIGKFVIVHNYVIFGQ